MAANLNFFRYLRFYLKYLVNAGIVVSINFKNNKMTSWLHVCVVYCVKQGSEIY